MPFFFVIGQLDCFFFRSPVKLNMTAPQQLMSAKDMKEFMLAPPGCFTLHNKVTQQNRRVKVPDDSQVAAGEVVPAFSTVHLAYDPTNYKDWALIKFPGIGYVLVDTTTFEKYFRRPNLTIMPVVSEKHGIELIHLNEDVAKPSPVAFQALQARPKPTCAICNQFVDLAQKSACGKCHQVYYCGRAHQRQHWPRHKLVCKDLAEQGAAARMVPLLEDTKVDVQQAMAIMGKAAATAPARSLPVDEDLEIETPLDGVDDFFGKKK